MRNDTGSVKTTQARASTPESGPIATTPGNHAPPFALLPRL